MRKDFQINDDVVFREFRKHRYILIQSWHNPSKYTKVIRTLNRIALAIIILIMIYFLWDKYVLGKNIILTLFLIFNPFLVIIISCLLLEIRQEVIDRSNNNTLGKSAKRVEYIVYKEYLKKISENRWVPLIILIFSTFLCVLSLSTSQHKWSINELEYFWKFDKDNCVIAFISIFGILLIILNLFFFKKLHFIIDESLRYKIYNQ